MNRVKKHIFNDEALALQAIEAVRWPNGIACARCGSHPVDRHGKALYRCKSCSRKFDYSTGTVLEQLSLPAPDLLYAVYTFSTHRYRASASAQLSSKLPANVIDELWRLIQLQCRTYKGYKRSFGRLVLAEMPPTPLRLAGVRKQRLLAAGKHQSQLTIYPRNLLTAPKSVARPRALGRCECLLVLLMR
jgi:transposase-like protein